MKAAKGTVSVLVRNQERDGVGTIQLRWRHQGKRYYLSLGQSATKVNLKMALLLAQAIERDILYQRFDLSLNKYQGQVDAPKIEEAVLNAFQVWQQYVKFREQSGAVAASMIVRDYSKVTKRLEKMPARTPVTYGGKPSFSAGSSWGFPLLCDCATPSAKRSRRR